MMRSHGLDAPRKFTSLGKDKICDAVEKYQPSLQPAALYLSTSWDVTHNNQYDAGTGNGF